MKKNYYKPEAKVVFLDGKDIIATSGEDLGSPRARFFEYEEEDL